MIRQTSTPDCIRFTDSIPGLFILDPFRVMNERTELAKGIDSDLARPKAPTGRLAIARGEMQ